MAIQITGSLQPSSDYRYFYKASCSIDFSNISASVSGGNIYVFADLKNASYNSASLNNLNYQIGTGSWMASTLAATQSEDLDHITLTGKTRTVPVIWDAVTDLNTTCSYDTINIRMFIYDTTNRVDINATTQLNNVDFTPSTVIPLFYPAVTSSNAVDIRFNNHICVKPTREQYLIEVDTTNAFSTESPDYLSIYSGDSQVSWSIDDSAFHPSGSLTPTSSIGLSVIQYSGSEINNLPVGSYYLRVSRFAFPDN